MLVSAAVCPAAPVLVPDVAQGAAPELDACRAACRRAIGDMLAASPDRVVVVGAGGRTARHPAGSVGTLQPIGVDVPVRLGPPAAPTVVAAATLPLSVTVGAWLLARHTWSGAVEGLEVDVDATPAACAALGADVTARPDAVGMLVVADGTARRGPRAPGYADDRAAAVDADWVDALAAGSPSGLLALDPGLCRALMMSGRAALQVLAGAAAGASVRARVDMTDDPYGVQYAVAAWQRTT